MRRQQGEEKISTVAPDILDDSLNRLREKALRTVSPASSQQFDGNSNKLEPDPSLLAR